MKVDGTLGTLIAMVDHAPEQLAALITNCGGLECSQLEYVALDSLRGSEVCRKTRIWKSKQSYKNHHRKGNCMSVGTPLAVN